MQQGYNERLFKSNPLRAYFHTRRFTWVEKTVRSLGIKEYSVVELGCFDGRLVSTLFRKGAALRYLGLDANREGGLSCAQRAHRDNAAVRFVECSTPEGFRTIVGTQRFDIGICLETFEHLSDSSLDGYITALAEVIDQYLIVSVPIERGLTLIARRLGKALLGFERGEQYTSSELFFAAMSRMDRVRRDQHKGFDERRLLQQLRRHFDIITVESIWPKGAPMVCAFQAGIVAAPRPSAAGSILRHTGKVIPTIRQEPPTMTSDRNLRVSQT